MADSDDEYDRKRRDKFRGERAEASYRGAERVARPRDDWAERDSWSRPRPREYRSGGGGGGGVRDRGYSPSMEPAAKRLRHDYYGDGGGGGGGGGGGYYNHYAPYHQAAHREPPPAAAAQAQVEGQQPPMMSFKAFLVTQDDNISDSEAIEKYNDYKLEFQRQQLNEFFVAHKDDEWFRLKYHPDDSVKRKEDQAAALKKRVEVFLELMNNGKLGVTVDCIKTNDLLKLLDTVVIKLEGGTDEDLALLEQEYAELEERGKERPKEAAATSDKPAAEETANKKEEKEADDKKKEAVAKENGETVVENDKNANSKSDDDGEIDKEDGEENEKPAKENNVKETVEEEEKSEDKKDKVENETEKMEIEGEDEGDKKNEKLEDKKEEADEVEKDEDKKESAVKAKKSSSKESAKKRKRSYSGSSSGSSSSSSSSSSESEDEKDKKDDDEGKKEESAASPSPSDAATAAAAPATVKEEPMEKEKDDEKKASATSSSSSRKEEGEEEKEKNKKDEDEKAKEERDVASKKEPIVVQTIEDDTKPPEKKPTALHKTTSIFLRNLAPTITKQEVEAVCSRYEGFLRVALADPQPERRWLRRGWVTFKRDANIKEICWNLNNIRLRDHELGAIVNRDLSRRIRPVNGITAHKQVVRSDIRISAKVTLHLDTKAGLWLDAENEKKDKPQQTFGLVSNNPVLHNITDYLIEEASAEEEELLGLEPTSETQDSASTVERDDSLLKVLDRIILYLRVVHSVDYYNHCEYPNEDEMPNRCGILHARGPPPTTKTDMTQFIGAPIEAKMASFLPEKPRDENKNEVKLVNMALKDVDTEIDKFVQANTRELAKDKWLCPLSGKKFKGPDFVRKHIFNKHAEKIEEVKKEVEFFNNYLKDPKRPMLPEAPQPKREEPPVYNHPTYGGGGGGGGSYGGYGRMPPYYNQGYSQRSRGYAPRGRGGLNDYRPVIHYRDLDAPREPEEFI